MLTAPKDMNRGPVERRTECTRAMSRTRRRGKRGRKDVKDVRMYARSSAARAVAPITWTFRLYSA